MALGPRELPLQLFVELALVECLGEAVAHDHLVDRFVVGVLDILLVQELEMHRADLEAVAAAQQRRTVHPLIVQKGAVRRAGILDRDLAPQMAQPGVTAGDGPHLGKTDVDVVGAADLERRARDQAVARAEAGIFRMGDEDDIRLERRAAGSLLLGLAVGDGDGAGSLPIVQLLHPKAVGGGLPLPCAAHFGESVYPAPDEGKRLSCGSGGSGTSQGSSGNGRFDGAQPLDAADTANGHDPGEKAAQQSGGLRRRMERPLEALHRAVVRQVLLAIDARPVEHPLPVELDMELRPVDRRVGQAERLVRAQCARRELDGAVRQADDTVVVPQLNAEPARQAGEPGVGFAGRGELDVVGSELLASEVGDRRFRRATWR